MIWSLVSDEHPQRAAQAAVRCRDRHGWQCPGRCSVDAPLPVLNLVYSVNYGGIGAGEADVSLKPDPAVGAKAGCYIYETVTRPVGFIKMLFGVAESGQPFLRGRRCGALAAFRIGAPEG